jgi:hypothetical protein
MRGASRRARAIAEGLVRTGRAYDPRTVGTHIRLRARAGWRFYWVAVDGGELLRGDALDMAEELQQTFVDAMAKGRRVARVNRKHHHLTGSGLAP